MDARGVRGIAIIALALCFTACAAPRSYVGISLVPGAASEYLHNLARRAQAGDKQAQLELGIRYEEGRGVPQDTDRAHRLYYAASKDTGGLTWLYTPKVGANGQASTVPVDRGSIMRGLSEAHERLSNLELRKRAQ
jgi:hypothetical protein